MKTRDYRLDLLRVLACLMVVTMHSPLPTTEENGLFLSTLSYLTAPGVGLFFMISGALLLPVKEKTGAFLRKRLFRIAIPLVVWSVIFIAIEYATGNSSPKGNPTYWFLFALAGLYLLAPILSRWLEKASRRELEFYLLIWGIGLLLPVIRPLWNLETGTTSVFYYFLGYAGYFVLGYYLKSYPERLRLRYDFPAMGLALLAPIICTVFGWTVDFYSVFWYLSIFVVIQCVFWWKTVSLMSPERLSGKQKALLVKVSQMTFGIYLVHYLLIRKVLWQWPFVQVLQPYPLQTATITIFAILLSLLLVWLMGFLPYARYWIGSVNSPT